MTDFLKGGVQKFSENIQSSIKDHTEDKFFARFVCYLQSCSGSFEMPKNFRLQIKGGNGITCSSNKGHNELALVDCDGVTIKGFKNGIIRLEGCTGIEKLDCGEAVKIVVGDADIQKASFGENCEVALVNCKVQELEGKKCLKIVSQKNKIEKLTLEGGVFYSEKDEFSGKVEITKQSRCTFVEPKKMSDLTIEDSTVTVQGGKIEKGKIKSGMFTMNDGEFSDELTIGE